VESVSVRQLFKHPEEYLDKTVAVSGWVRTVRDSKTIGFMELNDGSFLKNIQVVFEKDVLANYDEIAALPSGSAVYVEGSFVASPQSKQAYEVRAALVRVDGRSTPDYPLQKKRHSFEFLRTISHLRPRTNTFSAVFRLRSMLSFAVHNFFNERGFVYVHTPILTASDCEGAGEMFKVATAGKCEAEGGTVHNFDEFFGREAGLTVSGQLAAEVFCMAFGKVYTFGPTFRAEKSATARHAAEFWMIEPEVAFAGLEDDMDLAEDMIKYLVNQAMEKAAEEMEFFNSFIDKELFARLQNITGTNFERITYTEAIRILEKSGENFDFPVAWGKDIQTEHERYLTEKVFRKPVFVTDYPKDIKAFYMRLNDDGRTVAAMDLLVPGVGEIIGGSQREDRYDVLLDRIKELGLDPQNYDWYLDLRKYGGTRHAGFGMGFERMIMYMTGMSNIRDVIPFPRTYGSIDF
jgi:asparaginyl-tRNA synthetase